MSCPFSKLWFVVKVIVSSWISIPPLKNISLLSNSKNLFLSPKTGSNIHPEPFPPVNEIFEIDLISKSCGSTRQSTTLPWIIGSIFASTPPAGLDSTFITGGFITS